MFQTRSRLITRTLTCHGCRVKQEPWPHPEGPPCLCRTEPLLCDWWSDNNNAPIVILTADQCFNSTLVTSAMAAVWGHKSVGLCCGLKRLFSSRHHYRSTPALTWADWCVIELPALFDCPSKLKAEGTLSLVKPGLPGAPSTRSPGEWCADDLGGMEYNMNTIMLSGEIMAP